MKLDEYQYELRQLTESIEVQGDRYEFNIIGLAEEAGELMGKLKRALRGEGFDRVGYVIELSDMLGYLALAAGAREIELSDTFDSGRSPDCVEPSFDLVVECSKSLFSAINRLMEEDLLDNARISWHLSNVLWHINDSALAVEIPLSEVMEMNLAKLRDRLERNGTLLGTGDYR